MAMLSSKSPIMSSGGHHGKEVPCAPATSSAVHYYTPETMSKLESSSASNGISHGNTDSRQSKSNPAEDTGLHTTNGIGEQSSKEGTAPPSSNEKNTNNEINTQVQDNGQPTSSSDEPTTKIVLVGNPGVGKSTILNTLVGKAEFESGLSLGSGRTTKMKSYRQGEYEFIDTPGLEDVEHREMAANQISLAFCGPAKVKLIFIVILDSGRTRVADLSCMDVVLSAMEECGLRVANKHSIIINKCGPEVHRKLEEEGREVMTSFKFVRPVCHVSALQLDPKKEEEDNTMLAERENLLDFIRSAPILDIGEKTNIRVDVAAYEEKKRAMENEIKKLREALATLQNVPRVSSEFNTPATSLHTFGEEESSDEQSARKSDGSVSDALRRPVLNMGLKIAELVANAAKVPADKIRKL